MGTEVLIPLLLTAASTGASMYNTQRTQRKQDNALAQQMRNQQARQREADAKVADMIAEQAASTPDDERATATQNYAQALKQAKGQAEGGLVDIAGASDAYKDASRDAAMGIGDYGSRIAGLLSTIDAPYMQRTNEQFARNRGAGDLDMLARFASGDNFVDRMRLEGIRRNPWLDAFASIASGAAGSFAGGGRGGSQPGPYRSGYVYPGG